MCHVGGRAVLHAAGTFCFPLSVAFSGVAIEESCRDREKGRWHDDFSSCDMEFNFSVA